jgi:hypothetical protein
VCGVVVNGNELLGQLKRIQDRNEHEKHIHGITQCGGEHGRSLHIGVAGQLGGLCAEAHPAPL